MNKSVELAQESAKNPTIRDVSSDVNPYGKQCHEEISYGQIRDVEVCCGPHLPGGEDDHDDEGVTDNSHEDEQRNDDTLDDDLPHRFRREVTRERDLAEIYLDLELGGRSTT